MDIYANFLLGFLLIGAHHWARAMFYRLPLHNETGFFVSNDTVLNRRLNIRKGWHARFSGGNHLIPELFFSLVYLCVGGRTYAYYSRLLYTVLSMLLFPPIAIICFKLGMGPVEIWAGMFFLAFALAEPQFGGYFESGEQFELFGMLWGLALLLLGLDNGSPMLVASALTLWILSAFFIKFSFVVTPFVFTIQLVKAGEPILAIVIPWVIGIALYGLWLAILQRKPFELVADFLRHKLMGGHSLFSKQTLLLFYGKFQQMLDVFGRNLPMLLIAAFGFFHASSEVPESGFHFIFLLTMCLLISYFLQGEPAPCQTLPLVAPLVIWATYGVSLILPAPFTFWTAFAWLLIVGYYVVFFLRPKLMSRQDFIRWVWSTRPRNIPESEILKDLAFLGDIDRIKAKTFDFSVFLAGPNTQFYVLLGTSYPTNLVCAAPWLDNMAPGWQRELVDVFRVYPPPYILDTAESFSIAQAALWGFDYELLDENPGFWRLYGHRPDERKWKGQEGTPEIFDFTIYREQQA